MQHTTITLAALPTGAWQSTEGQRLTEDIRSTLTAYAEEAERLANHVSATRSGMTKELARFNEGMPHSQDFVVRSSELWDTWKGMPTR